MRESFCTHLFDKNTCIFEGGSQTSQAMGIYYQIIEENEKRKAFEALLDVIKLDDYHIATGVLGGRVLFHVLAENDNIIFELDYPQNAKGTFCYKESVCPANRMKAKTVLK